MTQKKKFAMALVLLALTVPKVEAGCAKEDEQANTPEKKEKKPAKPANEQSQLAEQLQLQQQQEHENQRIQLDQDDQPQDADEKKTVIQNIIKIQEDTNERDEPHTEQPLKSIAAGIDPNIALDLGEKTLQEVLRRLNLAKLRTIEKELQEEFKCPHPSQRMDDAEDSWYIWFRDDSWYLQSPLERSVYSSYAGDGVYIKRLTPIWRLKTQDFPGFPRLNQPMELYVNGPNKKKDEWMWGPTAFFRAKSGSLVGTELEKTLDDFFNKVLPQRYNYRKFFKFWQVVYARFKLRRDEVQEFEDNFEDSFQDNFAYKKHVWREGYWRKTESSSSDSD